MHHNSKCDEHIFLEYTFGDPPYLYNFVEFFPHLPGGGEGALLAQTFFLYETENYLILSWKTNWVIDKTKYALTLFKLLCQRRRKTSRSKKKSFIMFYISVWWLSMTNDLLLCVFKYMVNLQRQFKTKQFVVFNIQRRLVYYG